MVVTKTKTWVMLCDHNGKLYQEIALAPSMWQAVKKYEEYFDSPIMLCVEKETMDKLKEENIE